MKKRTLTEDETKLWRRVTENIAALDPRKAVSVQENTAAYEIKCPEKPGWKISREIKIEPKNYSFFGINSPLNVIPETSLQTPATAEHNWQQKINRDKARIEGKIDLHGMTQERAYTALHEFILRAYTQGKRLLLVITGKGRPKGRTDNGGEFENLYQGHQGILKRQVPRWLAQGDLGPLILSVSTARAKHGGDGALYVVLKRVR